MIIKIFEIVSVLSSLFRFNSFRYFLLRIICLSCRFSWNGWPPAHTYDVHAESEEAGWWVIVKIHETLREMTFVEQLTWFIKQRINLFDYFSPLTEQIFRTKSGACDSTWKERLLEKKEKTKAGTIRKEETIE